MGSAAKFRSAAATDSGRVRTENQDRSYVDDTLGIFLVVDGLGGHAAGEKAAETAVQEIRAGLAEPGVDATERVRSAIVTANNRIYELAGQNEAWRGMACVLTLAVLDGDRVVVGHVGDSRLYLIWNGAMRKLTSDHSPVGEREDRGELTEQEAMQHPRRHQVFRNVGSRPRGLNEDGFVEVREFLFKPDAAILLCSDGLSDLVTCAQMRAIAERYAGDPESVARELVRAANAAGGTDNITAIFVAGSQFIGSESAAMHEARGRHSITRARATAGGQETIGRLAGFARLLTCRAAFLVYGFVLGVVLALAWR